MGAGLGSIRRAACGMILLHRNGFKELWSLFFQLCTLLVVQSKHGTSTGLATCFVLQYPIIQIHYQYHGSMYPVRLFLFKKKKGAL